MVSLWTFPLCHFLWEFLFEIVHRAFKSPGHLGVEVKEAALSSFILILLSP